MPDRSDFWYRLGYALESARRGQTRASLDALSGSTSMQRRKDDRSRPRKPGAARDPKRADDGTGKSDGSGALDLLLAAGTGTVVSRLLSAWPVRRRPTLVRLVRAAVAGAGATLLRELLDPLLRGEARLPTWDDDLGQRLTAGVARGLIYGGVVDPRLPGPAAARGAAYGASEYLLSPWGGLRSLVGKHAPYRALPVVSTLLDDPETGEEAFLDHLVFGVALALIYGEGDDLRIGIGDDDV